MEWKQLESDWKQASTLLIAQWPNLTADDLTATALSQDQLVAKLHQRHGYTAADGAKQLDEWMNRTPFAANPPEVVADAVPPAEPAVEAAA